MDAVHVTGRFATSGGRPDGCFVRKLYGAFYIDRQPVSPGHMTYLCGHLTGHLVYMYMFTHGY